MQICGLSTIIYGYPQLFVDIHKYPRFNQKSRFVDIHKSEKSRFGKCMAEEARRIAEQFTPVIKIGSGDPRVHYPPGAL